MGSPEEQGSFIADPEWKSQESRQLCGENAECAVLVGGYPWFWGRNGCTIRET